MELVTSDDRGVRALSLIGRFERTDVEAFDAQVVHSIEDGCARVLLDTEHVRLVCSAALGAFIRAQERLQESGGDLVVTRLPHFARELFHTLGLDRRIHCFDTVEQGTRFFVQGARSVRLSLVGDFEEDDVAPFLRHVETSVQRNQLRIAVDGERLGSIGDDGVRALHEAHERLRALGGALALCDFPDDAVRAIEGWSDEHSIPTFRSETAAERYLRLGQERWFVPASDADIRFRRHGDGPDAPELLGTITRISDTTVCFRWRRDGRPDGPPHFPSGEQLDLSFFLRAHHDPSHVFRVRASVARSMPLGDQIVLVRAAFVDLSEVERRAIRLLYDDADDADGPAPEPAAPGPSEDAGGAARQAPGDDAA